MSKKSNFFDRLTEVLEFYRVDNLGTLATRLGYASAEKLYRLKRDKEAKPNYQFLTDLKQEFPDLNLNYLISGDGSIEITGTSMAAEPSTSYGSANGTVEHLIGLFSSAVAKELKPAIEDQAKINKDAAEKIEFIYNALSKVEYEKEATKLMGLLKALEKLKE